MLRIRPFRGGDEDAVVALREACGLVRPWNDPRRDVDRARGAGTSEIFVAIAASGGGERIVGSVMAGFDGHRGRVYYLAVAPGCRSRGLGARSMRRAEAWLEGIGAPEAMLMIREENEAVRRFYEGLGYGVERRTIMSGDRRRGRLAIPRSGIAVAPSSAVDGRGTILFHVCRWLKAPPLGKSG